MPFILDVAPICDEYVADVSYTACLGDNDSLRALKWELAVYRTNIRDMVGAGATIGDLCREMERIALELGHEVAHDRDGTTTLGHKLSTVIFRPPEVEPEQSGGRSRTGKSAMPLVTAHASRFGRCSPRWSTTESADDLKRPIDPGLWSVEPHLSRGELGAKWQELLVVTNDATYWLDNDVPHVREWAAEPGDDDMSAAPHLEAG
jgi:hypothetical protein